MTSTPRTDALANIQTPANVNFQDFHAVKYRELCRQLERELAAMTKLNHMPDGWIKVSKRKPGKNTTVMVWLGWVDVATYKPKYPGRKGYVWYAEPAGMNPVFVVTHWMPLPEPPEDT